MCPLGERGWRPRSVEGLESALRGPAAARSKKEWVKEGRQGGAQGGLEMAMGLALHPVLLQLLGGVGPGICKGADVLLNGPVSWSEP